MTFALLTDNSDISEITMIDMYQGSSCMGPVGEYWGAGQEVKISFSYVKLKMLHQSFYS